MQHVKVAVITIALSLPPFLWPPKPARAATVDVAPAMPALAAALLYAEGSVRANAPNATWSTDRPTKTRRSTALTEWPPLMA